MHAIRDVHAQIHTWQDTKTQIEIDRQSQRDRLADLADVIIGVALKHNSDALH